MSTQTKRIAFHTLGCKLNFSETSTISRDLTNNGFEKVKFKEVADCYVINTCSVTENADKEARKLIRQAKRKNPFSKIAVIGCYAQLKPNEIAKIDGVDVVLGANEKFQLMKYLNQINIEGPPIVVSSDINYVHKFKPSFSSEERTRAYLKVQDGCDYICSFCTIPMARGKSRSGTIKSTVAEVKKVVSCNNQEIVLTGINIGDFGKKNDESFIDLLKALDNIEKLKRIRISSIEPNLLTDDIIEFCNISKKLMPHFHIPLQSGSDKILRLMRRRYDTEIYKERIEKILKTNLEICIGVDVIVGFPGETYEDFLETYHFLNELNIAYLHVFSYSERDGTDAVNFKEKVSQSDRFKRSKMLHILSEKKQRDFYNNFINKKRPVLFEGMKNGFQVGYTDNYIKVNIQNPLNYHNQIIDVNLVENQGNYMIGVL
ncbi:MAG: tRNA (N(6)-L-threonylcarbamoyladenosine(37)-C(2))-methylthiotransferase MtaB [Candidatus Marinimicrobia bacterium]|nr:tRNA (N(6)-L-threonylcarbamoyladenosine(37)-C(2))-methylthiotransferase MtaB [Candidatus Neomarinimicrobiota bacterium]|tara:strand:- start:5435 stop:6727 length:1293 start_codon:yes stop_codon:yes gene_type:complete